MKAEATDILETFRLDAQQSVAYLAGIHAHGETLKEAMVNVFRMLPKCESFGLEEIRTLITFHPESEGKRLIESILAGANGA